ncbi:hypothetical protein HDE_03368 [Halotydeus destructor]|nr:hypothetical protein HDE_03368 [Halotydeus destructor]
MNSLVIIFAAIVTVCAAYEPPREWGYKVPVKHDYDYKQPAPYRVVPIKEEYDAQYYPRKQVVYVQERPVYHDRSPVYENHAQPQYIKKTPVVYVRVPVPVPVKTYVTPVHHKEHGYKNEYNNHGDHYPVKKHYQVEKKPLDFADGLFDGIF